MGGDCSACKYRLADDGDWLDGNFEAWGQLAERAGEYAYTEPVAIVRAPATDGVGACEFHAIPLRNLRQTWPQ